MKIKRYRAATMRAALEQVKQELGEDALVLDTKRVRAGGFLGLGAREMFEISVTVEAEEAAREKSGGRFGARRKSASNTLSLNLTDDAPALPRTSDEPPRRALAAARAYASENASANQNEKTASRSTDSLLALSADKSVDANRSASRTLDSLKQPVGIDADGDGSRSNRQTAASAAAEKFFRRVELSESAPRIIHRPQTQTTNAQTAKANANTPAANSIETPAASRTISNAGAAQSELERLRAELREVKFTLSAFVTRAHAAHEISTNAVAQFEETPELYDSPYYESYLALCGAGASPELACRAVRRVIESRRISAAQNNFSEPTALARAGLAELLPSLVKFANDPLGDAPSVVALVGATGVGKTTTLAKLAARVALRERRRVELITLDTYRIAAVEQLKTYAEIIGVGCHVARSVLELDALARKFSTDATVLIDTTGRNPHDLADQMELADYLRGNEEILKCLVMQASTHATDALATARKFALYGADRLILTKMDETSRPGALIDVAAETALPLVYLCAGQRVPEDISRATPESFAARIV